MSKSLAEGADRQTFEYWTKKAIVLAEKKFLCLEMAGLLDMPLHLLSNCFEWNENKY